MPFAQDFEQIDGCLPKPGIILLAHVDDDWFIHSPGKLKLLFQDFALQVRVFPLL